MDDTVISRAHDWVQRLPVADNMLLCQRCGIECSIANLPHSGPRCLPHAEMSTSGFKHEGRQT
jgi:hypothetical protein